MGLLRRRQPAPTPSELGELLLQGQDMLEQTTRAHQTQWGLGTADRWDLDQQSGVLRWTFADKVAEAPAQLLGSYSPAAGTWLWGWANPSSPPALTTAAEAVRAWGEAHGVPSLTQPQVEIDAEQADTLAAIAFRISRATGFYRPSAGTSLVFLTFGPVTVTPQEGEPRTVTIQVE